MPKNTKVKTNAVREPAQVYLAPDDSALLARLAVSSSLSKAEVLRRGIRSFAREQMGTTSPMLAFLAETGTNSAPTNAAVRHDELLAELYRAPIKSKKR